MRTTKLIILVVLYKQSLTKSETLKSLQKNVNHHLEGTLHIWDNSPNEDYCGDPSTFELQGFETIYSWHPDNTPLSVAYNKVSASVGNNDFLLILDQDSELPPDFLAKMEVAIITFPEISLFLPKVHNGSKLVSPGKLLIFKGQHLKAIKTGRLPSKNMLAISSGMMISKKYLQERKFDERLTLYGIDTRFMIDYAKDKKQLVVVPTTINHNTALWSTSDPDKLIPRLRNLISAWPIVFEEKTLARPAAVMYGYYLRFKMTIKYKNTRFLRLR